MYMGVIPPITQSCNRCSSAPHVYGGDPQTPYIAVFQILVLPMYMGVILGLLTSLTSRSCAPHVYGGDPGAPEEEATSDPCSPCIWG